MKEDRSAPLNNQVVVTDTSLNFGALCGRTAILKEVRDDEDGYNFRVALTDVVGLVTRKGVYETWVASVAPAAVADEEARR